MRSCLVYHMVVLMCWSCTTVASLPTEVTTLFDHLLAPINTDCTRIRYATWSMWSYHESCRKLGPWLYTVQPNALHGLFTYLGANHALLTFGNLSRVQHHYSIKGYNRFLGIPKYVLSFLKKTKNRTLYLLNLFMQKCPKQTENHV